MKSVLRLLPIAMLLSSLWTPLAAQDKINARDPVACDVDYSGPLVGANWELCYRQTEGNGIEIQHANFKGRSVLSQASQPFVLVSYHQPGPTYKEGLGLGNCGGAPLIPIPGTFSVTTVPVPDDENPGFPAFGGYPAGPAYEKLEISGIYDANNYRYRQVWTFHSNGDIDARYGFGGFLNPGLPERAHFHSPYWRFDFDIDVSSPNFFEEFSHPLIPPGLSGVDSWTAVARTGSRIGDPAKHQKWRVRSNLTNAFGQFHSYEIETTLGNTHEYTTASVWPVIYPGGDGTEVGTAACDDREIDSIYSNNPPGDDISVGADLVIWIAGTAHHETRNQGEESSRIPGFDYVGIKLSPRNFTDDTP